MTFHLVILATNKHQSSIRDADPIARWPHHPVVQWYGQILPVKQAHSGITSWSNEGIFIFVKGRELFETWAYIIPFFSDKHC